ncbi:MAG TPA: ABC transporter substrate-binding protein [Stellaceae bacterium]|nr:ABC transporter substrate-binding protein [Stellaceae bacterium]
MIKRHIRFAAAAVLIAGLSAPAARAADPAPIALIEALGGQLRALATVATPEQKLAQISRLFQQDFDVSGLGRFVLGRYWRMLDPPQQQEYLGLFQNYVVLAYSGRLLQIADSGSVPRVLGSRPEEDDVIVFSEIVQPSGNWTTPASAVRPVRVDWRLSPDNGGYRISDVVIDGLSLAANGRSQLAGVIERNGGQAQSVLAVLRQQIRAAAAGR